MIGARLERSEPLPAGWVVRNVGEIGSYLNGYPFRPTQWTDKGLPIIRIQNLTDEHKPFNYFEGKINSRYLIVPGNILVSWSASLGAFLWKRGAAWLNQHIFKATPNAELVEHRFFYFLMRHTIERIAKNARGSTMHHVTLNEFAYSEVAIPPSDEQRQIATLLSATQLVIERQERLIALAAELKKALMHKLFTEGSRGEPVKETEFGPMPESWRLERVGAVCRSIVPGRNKPHVFDGDIPWLTTPEIKKLTYITDSIHSRRVSGQHLHEIGGRIVPANSIIMTCLGEFGIAAINLVPVVVNQQLHAFICPSDVNPYFLCQMLRMRSTYMEQIAHKTTVPYLNKSKCESIPIAIPPIQEQNEITAVLQQVDARIEVARRYEHCMEGLFRTLLHQLMTAQIRVHDLDLSALEEAEQEPVGVV